LLTAFRLFIFAMTIWVVHTCGFVRGKRGWSRNWSGDRTICRWLQNRPIKKPRGACATAGFRKSVKTGVRVC